MRSPEPGGPSRLRRWWPMAALAAAGLLVWGLVQAPHLGAALLAAWNDRREDLLGLLAAHPLVAPAAIFLLHALLAALALPGASLLMLLAGAAYGAWAGTLLCLAGCTAGATLAMVASRRLLRPWVRRRFGAQLADLDWRIARGGAACLFGLRLLPVVPFALVNVAAGLSTMGTWTFTWVSFAGMLVGTFVYVQAGAGLAQVREAADLASPGLLLSLVALAVVPWLVWRQRRQPSAAEISR